MRRFALALALVFVSMQTSRLHAVITSRNAHTLARFKKVCDEQGQGKACYDYGRMMWREGGSKRKIGKRYVLRACELKFIQACEDYQANNALRSNHSRHKKTLPGSDGPSGPCFAPADLDAAKFYPNMISATGVHGQLINNIRAKSFWERVEFQEGDIITRINNRPFNSTDEAVEIFSSSGKRFSFEIERNHETTTLWYSCK